ncbi:MAG: SH3 domain-containing protein [Legionellaceae bacterium]|nr:SH3 domain-containing protein [Legionellaceae bacterium]
MRLFPQVYFKVTSIFCLIVAMSYATASFAVTVPRESFPIESYTQDADAYISPKSLHYTKSLLSIEEQQLRLKQFYQHYYASDAKGLSPWSQALVSALLPRVKKAELRTLAVFDNQTKPNAPKHYAENFRAHDAAFWRGIQRNMNLNALDNGVFDVRQRAIVTRNTATRVLPEKTPDFFDERTAGEGFPFDNLQIASLWVGTPLYVFSTSKDKAWSLVLTPDAYFAWVKSSDIGYVSSDFVARWQKGAEQQLVAVTQTEVSILDKANRFQFTGYIGAVFPEADRNATKTSILFPVRQPDGMATIKTGIIETKSVARMPLAVSPKHMAAIIKELQHRPYGWGGAFFLNDCSQELKSLFTPFAIWLPRSSWMQQALNPTLDLSAHSLEERLNTVKVKGHPFLTLLYKRGHIVLYVGEKNIQNHSEVISYQNVWALSPKQNDTRYVIGGGVFLPILKSYPDNPRINSQANESVFKLIHLDAFHGKERLPNEFAEMF